MRDDDRMLDLPDPEFGSGVIGTCDICGTRQAVIVLSKERFKLCVIDFLNKAWIKTDRKPGVPAPVYRSERVWFDTAAMPGGKAPAVVLSPTKVVKHPAILVVPDVYGITTTLLDAAIRFAREGFEVLLPDLGKTDTVGAATHLSLRGGVRLRGGVSVRSKKVSDLLRLYRDGLDYLLSRDMVDRAKAAVFGTSYGASLALAFAAENTLMTAAALAYPMPVRPKELAKLVTVPVLALAGSYDRASLRALADLRAAGGSGVGAFTLVEIPSVRHDFLSRDLSAYNLGASEAAWTQIVGFLKQQLMPPPPKPPAAPVRTAAASSAPPSAAPPPSASSPPPVAATLAPSTAP